MTLTPDTVLHTPPLERISSDGHELLIDRDGPNWLATDGRGAELLQRIDGRSTLAELVGAWATERGVEAPKAWAEVDTIVRDALRRGLVSDMPVERAPYVGREPHLRDLPLEELWLHTNNSCNLACTHCLVSSGPDGDRGLPLDHLTGLVDQARALGTTRFYVTGGEPFLRRDLADLVDHVLTDPDAELVILTNAMLLPGRRIEALAERHVARVRLQVSLDGATAATNDAVRGEGAFERAVAGVRAAVEHGFHVTISTVITADDADEVADATALAADLGAQGHHLLWLHKRGRADGGPDTTPPVERVAEIVRACRRVARERGIVLDNHESVKARLMGKAGVKRDLSNACVTSLCVYSDGRVFPSAATAGEPDLVCGDTTRDSLASIWRESDVVRRFREASVVRKPLCGDCSLRFLCGGGDVEHAYFWGGSLDAHDPYCELHKSMFADAFEELVTERADLHPGMRAGFAPPVAVAAMGESGSDPAHVENEREVAVSHSECVLLFDLDESRGVVREFYGDAAEQPQEELCCPVQPAAEDLSHIPDEVVERFYGCGSPVGRAGLAEGETFLDLGSGAGIDVFIAAKYVGPSGRAIGVDMTPQMLQVARESRPKVAERLGYDVVEFREGFLEDVPVEDGTVDLVTSNCVVNLSPDKKRVFREIWRVLRDHGRLVLSDIVSEEPVPAGMRQNPRLWGECISGALTEDELLAYLERADFYGLQVLSRTFWKEVEGHRFHSVTVRGEKFEKREDCVFEGHWATYLGPFKGVSDEEGHWFPRNVAVEICTDTLAKLTHPPYAGHFRIEAPDGEVEIDPRHCAPNPDGTACC